MKRARNGAPHDRSGKRSRPRERLAGATLDRFLRLLGIAPREPSLAALRELVTAYVTRIPFENVSKVYRWRRHGAATVPEIGAFLDGVEGCGFGGTCYTNNYHLYTLLATLGFDVTLCAADMRHPGVHMVVLVRSEGREYLVDDGYAAPFLEPLPRDLPVDHVVALGEDRYVLRPRDEAGRSRLEMRRDGEVEHGYLVQPAPRRLADFAGAIADSFRPDATFLNALLLARFQPGAATVIRNLTLLEARGREATRRVLRDRDELLAEIERRFGMPPAIVADVLDSLGPLSDPFD